MQSYAEKNNQQKRQGSNTRPEYNGSTGVLQLNPFRGKPKNKSDDVDNDDWFNNYYPEGGTEEAIERAAEAAEARAEARAAEARAAEARAAEARAAEARAQEIADAIERAEGPSTGGPARSPGAQSPVRSPGAKSPVRRQGAQRPVRSPGAKSPGAQRPVRSPGATKRRKKKKPQDQD